MRKRRMAMITLSITKLVLFLLSMFFFGISAGVMIQMLIQHIFSTKSSENDTKNTQNSTDNDSANCKK